MALAAPSSTLLTRQCQLHITDAQHAAWLAEYAELGVDDVYAFHVSLEQRAYIDAFGAKVLPQLVR